MRKSLPKPIFFDTGSRWKKFKLLNIRLFLFIGIIIFATSRAFYYSPFHNNTFQNNHQNIDKEIERINNESRPVVNQGTFIALENLYGNTYVKRFGEEKKVVVLTFDDGPDPTITPKLLAVLKKEQVNGTFFVLGSQIYKYPEVGRAILTQGSDMGLHTFSHYENREDKPLDDFTFIKELDFTEKIFAYHYGYKAKLFRIPYLGLDPLLSYNSLQYVREALKRNLTISAPTVDSEDWNTKHDYKKIAQLATTSDVQTAVILFHDAGGKREATIQALPHIIKFYKDRGYTFTTISELARSEGLPYKEPLTLVDRIYTFISYQMYDAYKQSPRLLTHGFIIGFILVMLHMGIFVFLALIQNMLCAWRRAKFKKTKNKRFTFTDLVSIVIPMHNEERAIRPTMRAILRSSYTKFELIVVNDGSTDNSFARAQELTYDPRVKILTKVKGGKFSALNYGLKHAKGKVIVFIDADTRITPSALRRILLPFSHKKVGAVAGNIRVGNKRNIITKLQDLEYLLGQHIDKRVHELFKCVPVVPGAFGAWRTHVIRRLGGFSYKTHAEDFDLTLSLIEKGYEVRYGESANALTEAPASLSQLLTQRFRWNFGNLQVYFKYRELIFNRKFGFFGMILLPRAVFLQIPAIFITPLVDLFVLTNLLIGERILTIFFLFLYFILQFLITVFAYIFSRRPFENLFYIVFLRFPYTQIMYFVIFIALLRAVKGEILAWSKLHHTGRLSLSKVKI